MRSANVMPRKLIFPALHQKNHDTLQTSKTTLARSGVKTVNRNDTVTLTKIQDLFN